MMNKMSRKPILTYRPRSPATPLLVGVAASLALLGAWSLTQNKKRPVRRFADRAQDRRDPLSLFAAGPHPRRREIDLSGAHPLFERRQSAYEAY